MIRYMGRFKNNTTCKDSEMDANTTNNPSERKKKDQDVQREILDQIIKSQPGKLKATNNASQKNEQIERLSTTLDRRIIEKQEIEKQIAARAAAEKLAAAAAESRKIEYLNKMWQRSHLKDETKQAIKYIIERTNNEQQDEDQKNNNWTRLADSIIKQDELKQKFKKLNKEQLTTLSGSPGNIWFTLISLYSVFGYMKDHINYTIEKMNGNKDIDNIVSEINKDPNNHAIEGYFRLKFDSTNLKNISNIQSRAKYILAAITLAFKSLELIAYWNLEIEPILNKMKHFDHMKEIAFNLMKKIVPAAIIVHSSFSMAYFAYNYYFKQDKDTAISMLIGIDAKGFSQLERKLYATCKIIAHTLKITAAICMLIPGAQVATVPLFLLSQAFETIASLPYYRQMLNKARDTATSFSLLDKKGNLKPMETIGVIALLLVAAPLVIAEFATTHKLRATSIVASALLGFYGLYCLTSPRCFKSRSSTTIKDMPTAPTTTTDTITSSYVL